MARRSSGKPWLHEKSGYWCSTVSGKRVYLDKDYNVACRKLREAIANLKREEQGATSDWLDVPIANLADEFLDDIKSRKKPETHTSYRYRLLRALRIVGPSTRVADLGKIHLAKIERRMTGKYSPTTIKDTIAVLQSVFALAVKHDLIIENPLAGFEKPAGRARKAGEQLVLYCNRHTFGTQAVGKVSDIELATLMGHTDVRATQRYVHINTDRLRDIQRRAIGKARESA